MSDATDIIKRSNETANILVVDDEESIRVLLGHILESKGYQYTLAKNASEARLFAEKDNYDLVLCDVNMPGESGLDLSRHLIAAYPDTPVIMVTARSEADMAEIATSAGVYAYIIKPFRPGQLLIDVGNALHRRKLEIENRQHRQFLEKIVEARTAELKKAIEETRRILDGVIKAMARTLEMRDPYTAGHQRRVAELAFAVANEMKYPQEVTASIRMAGLIHDLGKIAVPAEILSKPGKITEMEFALIKIHPQVGHDILEDIDFPWPLSNIVLQHHERLDGSGYPQSLRDGQIDFRAKVLAVADVVEAMSSHRPYRAALGIDASMEEISAGKGLRYDPAVVDACVKLFASKTFSFDQTI